MVGMLLMRARLMDVEETNLSIVPCIHRPMHIFVREMDHNLNTLKAMKRPPLPALDCCC